MFRNWTFNAPRSFFPVELRLIRRAKAGDVLAFLELSNPYVVQVYRYIHFLVPTSRIAEALTLQVFFKAWKQLAELPLFGSSFPNFLFSIAHDQVNEYFRTHHTAHPSSDTAVSVVTRGGEYRSDHQLIRDTVRKLQVEQRHVLVLKLISGLSDVNIARVMGASKKDVRGLFNNSLRTFTGLFTKKTLPPLPADFDRILASCLHVITRSASSLDDYLFLHPEFDASLKPFFQSAALLQSGNDIKPFPTFDAYIKEALANHLRARQHTFRISGALVRRGAMALLILAVAFLSTGTAYAQNAMPGDSFYSWKRASENIWLAFASDSTVVDLVLAERRLEEWLVVAGDPSLAEEAKQSYQAALDRLMDEQDEEDMDEVLEALQYHDQVLEQAGISNPSLDAFLALASEQPQTEATPLTVTSSPSTQSANTDDSLEDDCPNGCDMDEFINPPSISTPAKSNASDTDEDTAASNSTGKGNQGKGNQGKGNSDEDNGQGNNEGGKGKNK